MSAEKGESKCPTECANAKWPKPVMRGLHLAQTKRNLVMAGVFVGATVLSMYYLRNEPRKRDYAEFYKTYDAEKAFQRMRDAGLLQSCPKI